MDCPKCRAPTLEVVAASAAALEAEHWPSRCGQCGGFWLEPHTISALFAQRTLDSLDQGDTSRADEDRKVGLCPHAHGILTRAKVSWKDPCYVERCSKCAGLWLDAGEWRRLIALEIIEHLDDVWEPSWRRQLQREEASAHLAVELRDKLGTELAEQVESVARALATHAHRNLALAYLQEAVRAVPVEPK